MLDLPMPTTPLHYDRKGRGQPALLFVHGALCDHRNWRHQILHFCSRHQVVAPDLRGHGLSPKPSGRIGIEAFAADIIELCDILELQSVVLVGHSMGCRVLLQAAHAEPRRFAGLVFVDGAWLVPTQTRPGRIRSRETRKNQATQARMRAASLYAETEPAVRVRTGFSQMFYDARFNQERDAIITAAAALPSHVARELMPSLASWDALHLEDTLAKASNFGIPMLAIACTAMDSDFRRRSLAAGISTPWLDALNILAPQAEVLRWHGGGHFPMLERPADINNAIEAFLAFLSLKNATWAR